jgi:cytochrome c oxidase assembly factor 4
MPTIVLDPPSKDKTEQNPTSPTDNDDEDHVTSAIRKTGCYQFHEKLQECYIEKKDWRDCAKEMKEFRSCMQKIQRTTAPSSSSLKQ